MSPRMNPILTTVGFETVQRNWGWFLLLGIVQVVLGTIALGESVLMTVFSIVMLGWLLIIGGIASVVHAFSRPRARGSGAGRHHDLAV